MGYPHFPLENPHPFRHVAAARHLSRGEKFCTLHFQLLWTDCLSNTYLHILTHFICIYTYACVSTWLIILCSILYLIISIYLAYILWWYQWRQSSCWVASRPIWLVALNPMVWMVEIDSPWELSMEIEYGKWVIEQAPSIWCKMMQNWMFFAHTQFPYKMILRTHPASDASHERLTSDWRGLQWFIPTADAQQE